MGPLATPGVTARPWLPMEAPAARRPIRAASVLTAGPVGIKILKTYHTANIRMILNYTDFTDDKEKMKDFFYLTKERFLESYSYLTEEEYNLTLKKVNDLASS